MTKRIHPISRADVLVHQKLCVWMSFTCNCKLSHVGILPVDYNVVLELLCSWTLWEKDKFHYYFAKKYAGGEGSCWAAMGGRGGASSGKLVWNPALQHCHLLATAHIPPLKPAGLCKPRQLHRDRDASFCYTTRMRYLLAHQTMSSWLWCFDEVLFDPFS